MDNILNKLFPTAKCAEAPQPQEPIDPMALAMDEDAMGPEGNSDDFKRAIDFKMITNRRTIFGMESEKIEGFKFSISLPLSQSFILQNKWNLYPPQGQAAQPSMMAMMMPNKKTSNYELDMVYIHGAPENQMEMMNPKFDQTKIINFRAGVKGEGIIEAMIMKKLSENVDCRFEGQFLDPMRSQWNLSLTHNGKD